jgi:hypothetical protein
MQRTQANWSRFGWRALLAGAALCLAIALAPTPKAAEAVPTGSLSMSPSTISLAPSESVAITVILNSGVDIHEVHLALGYDPTIVQLVDAQAGQAGVQVLQGPFPEGTAPGTMLQNTASGGFIAYQYVLPAGESDAGTGTVLTMQFVALAAGNANLTWLTTQVVDAAGVPATLTGTAASLVVGAVSTPVATDTPAPLATATETPAPAATETPTSAATATGTTEPTATATQPATATATATKPAATATPKITVVEDSNQGLPPQSSGGVDPSQSDRAGGLPSAGIADGGIAWWRWVFFLAALMFGIAGWFFTLAVYNGSQEVVLIDRFDKRRRRK